MKIPGLEPGGTVAVLATGPSLTLAACESVRHLPCIAVCDAYKRAPWAAVLYAHDALWWTCSPDAVHFDGVKVAGQLHADIDEFIPAPYERVLVEPGKTLEIRTSGLAAIRLAAAAGAKRILALGFDPAGHFHNDHKLPRVKPEPEIYRAWQIGFDALARELAARGVELVRHTAPALPPLLVHGMGGLGDNIHQRAVVRELARKHEVWLRTPFPAVYHDMPHVHALPLEHPRRLQRLSVARAAYAGPPVPAGAPALSIGYDGGSVRAAGSVVAAMAASAGVAPGDFGMAVSESWAAKLPPFPADRPILVYRPLLERASTPSHATRNPDPLAYRRLYQALRRDYFVVSLANLDDAEERIAGGTVRADLTLHRGELDLEGLMALFARAALVYTAPGFATVLAQAVGAPCITVFGGYERATSFSAGAQPGRWLAIEPVEPCACWRAGHDCDKTIDLKVAAAAVRQFEEALP